MIRVAAVNTARSKGGAARMAALLVQALHDRFDDIAVTLYHCEDRLNAPPFCGLQHRLSRPLNALLARLGGSTWVWDMGVAQKIVAHTNDADILHIHNLHGYYLDYPTLLSAWSNRPVVWTMHDMWGLSGRCGFTFNCDRWHQGCYRCPHKDYYPKAWVDRAKKEFKTKSTLYSSMNRLTIAAPSKWLANLVIERGFPEERVRIVPNPVDSENICAIDKQTARKALDLPDDAFIALFVASDCGDPRKGYADFASAISQSNCCGVAVGKHPPRPATPIRHTGRISDPSVINRYYAAADVFIIPTYADNYPNTVIEALVSGTPVIGYAEGGIPSQLDLPHCHLVTKGDRRALVSALQKRVLNGGKDSDTASKLSDIAKRRWALDTAAANYRHLYQAAMAEQN
jgi:glycosyltransferase involved in cell wall biosynthesis